MLIREVIAQMLTFQFFLIVASLLGCLHQLKSDNMKLEKKLTHLQSRKDRLLGLNARLAGSFAESTLSAQDNQSIDKVPLSTMLSNLNESEKRSIDEEGSPAMTMKKSKIEFESPDKLFSDTEHAVPSPDLAMLAAASAKFDSRMSSRQRKSIAAASVKQHEEVAEEKPPILQLSSSPVAATPPTVHPSSRISAMEDSGQSSNLLNGVLHMNHHHHRQKSYQQEYMEVKNQPIGYLSPKLIDLNLKFAY